MNVGFLGLGKLGLPCALAIASKGHSVYGYDIDLNVKKYIEEKKIPYREEGVEELLQDFTVHFTDIENVVNSSDIIFVPIQTPHEYKYEGCTRIPEERDDFNYEWLKDGIKQLSDIIKLQSKDKVVVIISTVLPGTIEREIKPIIQYNEKLKLCYNPFFIAMGTTVNDFLNPEFVLFGVDDKWAADITEEFYKTIHDKPFYKTDIINAELIKVCYNTFIGMKIVYANTIMEICHKTGANVDQVIGGIKLATDRVVSTKYLSGGMGDGGGCVLPSFEINVNNKIYNIKDLYYEFHKNREETYLVDSANYTCNTKQQKKIYDVTTRKYKGKLYTFRTKDKEITVTGDHLIPIERNSKRIIVRAEEIKKDDKFYIIDDYNSVVEKIVEIFISDYEGEVYNLEVEPYHEVKDDQFYIDNSTGIVVHNCHPRDNIAMSWLAKKLELSHNFFEDVMKAREDQTEFLADVILEQDGPYYIMGKTFKEETNLIIGSPAILLRNILEERDVEVIHYDPFIDDDIEFVKGTYFVATRHNQFKYFKFPKGSTVIDVWRFLSFEDDDKINHIKVGGEV